MTTAGAGQIYRWLEEAVPRAGSQRSLDSQDTTLSRRGLIIRADKRARELQGLKIGAGDIVALSMGNVAEFVILLLAVSKLGAVAMPVDPANGDRCLLAAARRLPIRDFYKDDGMAWLDLAPDELLVAVEVPLAEGWASAYDKLRIRGAVDFPLVGVAVALRREGDAIAGLRVACTGVSCRPELIDGLEPLLGKALDKADLAVLDKRLLKCTQPMETTVVSVPYRRRAMPVLARRVLGRLWEGG